MSQMIPFSLKRDINGYNGFGLEFSNYNIQTTLQAGVAQQFVVPTTASSYYNNVECIFSFSPGSSVWVSINGTAQLPGSSFLLTNSQLNPAGRTVAIGDTISVICSDSDVQVGVSFYAVY